MAYADPAKRRAYEAKRYRENPERRAAIKRYLSSAKGLATKKACDARLYQAQKPKRLMAMRAWVKANPERRREIARAYYRRNKSKVQETNKRCRLLRGGADYTVTDLAALIEAQRNRCWYCGEEMESPTKEHVVPVCRGGPDSLTNLVMACRPCNERKGRKLPEEWLF